MIAYLKGNITYKSPTHIHLECAGVGYMVNISLYTFEAIEGLESTKIYTYLHITEDAHTLFGFHTAEEKELFLQLLSVQGVGASTARLFLSSFAPKDLHRAIINEEIGLLKSVKGIGLKTAQRIVLELKDKLGKRPVQSDVIPGMQQGASNRITDEALSALAVLGFQRNAAEKVVLQLMKNDPSIVTVEQLIKLSLKSL
jgi:holliday junction DNA helicase RuvA